MDYSKLFYWLTVADNAKVLFITGIVVFTTIAVIATVVNLICRAEDKDSVGAAIARNWIKWSYPIAFLFWSLYIFTPSKRDALLIVAGGQTMNFLTTDSTAKQIPHELSNFVVTELKNMAKEAQVDLNLNSQKDKILEEAKSMTTEQVLNKIKTDSTYAKILLDK